MVCTKKKLKLSAVVYTFFFIFSGIPFNLLRLYYRLLIKNETSFKKGLQMLCVEDYNRLKDRKIEVLNGKVYLNGGGRVPQTVGQLCKRIGSEVSDAQVKAFFTEIREIASHSFKDLRLVEYRLGIIETVEGVRVSPH
jgi:hypothetical protein